MREMGRKKKSLMVDAAQKISPATDHSKIINIEDVNCYKFIKWLQLMKV